MSRIKYNIIRGRVVEYSNTSKVKASELLCGFPQIDDSEIVLSTYNKSEAESEFSKYKCDATINRTQTGFQIEISYFEMEEIEVDDDDDVLDYIKITVSPFVLDEYECR